MKQRRTLFALAAVVGTVALTSALLAQSTEPWFGTWKLNVARSKYSPGPGPKTSTTKLEPWEGGFKHSTEFVTAQGETRHVEYTGKFDGKDNLVAGHSNADTINYRRIDDHTYEVVEKKNGKATTTATVVISGNGLIRTQTMTGKNAQGQTVNNVLSYDRQ